MTTLPRAPLMAGIALFVALGAPPPGPAEGALADTTLAAGWNPSLEGGLGLTQAEYENYSRGGESSLTWAAYLFYKATENRETRLWRNEALAQFGQTMLSDGEIRKSLDRLRLSSVHTWILGAVVDPYVAFEAESQLAKGYVYPRDQRKVTVSRFGNPWTLKQAAGASRTWMPGFSTRLGVALREWIVTDEQFAWVRNADKGVDIRYTDDPGTEKIEKSRVETGIESVTDLERGFQNDRYKVKSQLKLFTSFEDIATVDVEWLSRLSANLISFVNVFVETEVLYNEDVLPRTQFRETLSIGLAKTFF